jgi:hypothetical protein
MLKGQNVKVVDCAVFHDLMRYKSAEYDGTQDAIPMGDV